jgi:5-methylcytosine-specific restriction endonuclease McrA
VWLAATMSNKWNIPDWIEKKVMERDKYCVYCNVEMKEYSHTKGTPRDKATFEHIDNYGSSSDENNIAMCCTSCNSSRGAKKLLDWFESPYCKKKNITKETVASPIKRYLEMKN